MFENARRPRYRSGGVSLQDWVYILTLVYLVLQIAYLVWKFWRRSRNAGDE